MTTVFLTWPYGRLIATLEEINFIERIKAPMFLEAVLEMHRDNVRAPIQFRTES